MKTIEQLKEEYIDSIMDTIYKTDIFEQNMNAFDAGYEAAQRWISVKDDPIPLNILCNVVDVKGRVFNCNFRTENDMRFGIDFYKITHYLPIPKLPTK
jgi:hypothetical protein